jgi:hypothetical protein
LRAAREQVLPALYPHAARGLPVLTDKDYTGAGVGIHAAIKQRPYGQLHIDNRCHNELIQRSARPPNAATPCSAAGALDRVTVCPQRISAIAAALVLTSLDRESR